MVANEHKQLIVRFKQHYQSKFQQDLVDAWSLNAFSVVKLGATTDFQQTEMSHSNKDFWLVVEFIIPNSEGERYVLKSTFRLIVKYELIDASRSEGAQAAAEYHSKMSLHFS
jgi:hypothetical protein